MSRKRRNQGISPRTSSKRRVPETQSEVPATTGSTNLEQIHFQDENEQSVDFALETLKSIYREYIDDINGLNGRLASLLALSVGGLIQLYGKTGIDKGWLASHHEYVLLINTVTIILGCLAAIKFLRGWLTTEVVGPYSSEDILEGSWRNQLLTEKKKMMANFDPAIKSAIKTAQVKKEYLTDGGVYAFMSCALYVAPRLINAWLTY